MPTVNLKSILESPYIRISHVHYPTIKAKLIDINVYRVHQQNLFPIKARKKTQKVYETPKKK